MNFLSKAVSKFVSAILGLYIVSVLMFALPYYNWQYAKEHGFLRWLFLGEIVATAKSVAWPYFVFKGIVVGVEQAVTEYNEFNILASTTDHAGFKALKRGDYAEAAMEFRKSAKEGDIASQVNLGSLYRMGGRGLARDPAEAYRWFHAAAEQGNREAQYSIANMLDLGDGVPKDYRMAAKWYTLSAEQGQTNSQFNLGILYANGQGVSADPTQAYFWLDVAFTGGHARAGRLRDTVASKMTSKQIEQAKALVRAWKPRAGGAASPRVRGPGEK